MCIRKCFARAHSRRPPCLYCVLSFALQAEDDFKLKVIYELDDASALFSPEVLEGIQREIYDQRGLRRPWMHPTLGVHL